MQQRQRHLHASSLVVLASMLLRLHRERCSPPVTSCRRSLATLLARRSEMRRWLAAQRRVRACHTASSAVPSLRRLLCGMHVCCLRCCCCCSSSFSAFAQCELVASLSRLHSVQMQLSPPRAVTVHSHSPRLAFPLRSDPHTTWRKHCSARTQRRRRMIRLRLEESEASARATESSSPDRRSVLWPRLLRPTLALPLLLRLPLLPLHLHLPLLPPLLVARRRMILALPVAVRLSARSVATRPPGAATRVLLRCATLMRPKSISSR